MNGQCQCCLSHDEVRDRTVLGPVKPAMHDSSSHFKIPEVRVVEVTICDDCAKFIGSLLARLA